MEVSVKQGEFIQRLVLLLSASRFRMESWMSELHLRFFTIFVIAFNKVKSAGYISTSQRDEILTKMTKKLEPSDVRLAYSQLVSKSWIVETERGVTVPNAFHNLDRMRVLLEGDGLGIQGNSIEVLIQHEK